MMIIILIVICAIILFIIIKSIIEANQFEVTKYIIESDKVERNKKFVVLTDLHNRKIGRSYDKLIGAIDDIAPDMVLIVGDMINKNKVDSYQNAIQLLNNLADKYEVIYVNGNHEQILGEKLSEYKELLYKKGVIFLANGRKYIGDNICIHGLEIDHGFYKHYSLTKMNENYICRLLGQPDLSRYNILLIHTPAYFKNYVKWGADLAVAGHNHGGAIRLPVLGGIISPQFILFPKYYAGRFHEKDSDMLVSRGIGSHSINIRVFNKPEVMVIELKHK